MIAVSPVSQNFSLEAGGIYTGKIKVANPANSKKNLSYIISVAPYGVIGKEYNADLTTMYDRSMLVDWIKIDNPNGELRPNETRDINFTITVPKSAPPGGQYASILVTEDDNGQFDKSENVGSVFEIASLIYSNVTGDIISGGEVLENNIPGLVTSNPIITSALISNTGNTHQVANISLKMVDNFGNEILSSNDDNSRHNEVILPETTRNIKYSLENIPIVGVVKVTQTIHYGDIESIETKDVVICPVWFMALMLVLFIFVIWGIIVYIKKIFKKHRK